MRKIRFYLSIGFATAKHVEDFEFPDDVSDEEIEEEYQEWADDYIEKEWYDVVDEDD